MPSVQVPEHKGSQYSSHQFDNQKGIIGNPDSKKRVSFKPKPPSDKELGKDSVSNDKTCQRNDKEFYFSVATEIAS